MNDFCEAATGEYIALKLSTRSSLICIDVFVFGKKTYVNFLEGAGTRIQTINDLMEMRFRYCFL